MLSVTGLCLSKKMMRIKGGPHFSLTQSREHSGSQLGSQTNSPNPSSGFARIIPKKKKPHVRKLPLTYTCPVVEEVSRKYVTCI